jgi:hypothetical protein
MLISAVAHLESPARKKSLRDLRTCIRVESNAASSSGILETNQKMERQNNHDNT